MDELLNRKYLINKIVIKCSNSLSHNRFPCCAQDPASRVYLNAPKIIPALIIYMKKLLDSDWLRAVQFKCNTSAKSVTPVQITPHNSDYD